MIQIEMIGDMRMPLFASLPCVDGRWCPMAACSPVQARQDIKERGAKRLPGCSRASIILAARKL